MVKESQAVKKMKIIKTAPELPLSDTNCRIIVNGHQVPRVQEIKVGPEVERRRLVQFLILRCQDGDWWHSREEFVAECEIEGGLAAGDSLFLSILRTGEDKPEPEWIDTRKTRS